MRSHSSKTPAYTLAGLRIVSEFPLSGIPFCRDEAATRDAIAIRRAPVPEALSAAAATFPNAQFNGTEVLLDFPEVGRFLVRDGNEILMDPAPASDENEVRVYLLGTAFGLACHQRGITPLHASAIEIAGGCVAFVGASGAGKSTLVAALAQRGYQVIADDVCFLQTRDGEVQVWPGIPRIRLWEGAMEALGCGGPGVERELRGWNKYLIPVQPPRQPFRPRRLRRIYQLNAAPDGAGAHVTRLHGSTTLETLMQNVYRLEFAEHMGCKPAAFVVCASAARTVPLFRFSRPLGFDALRDGVECLQAHLQDIC